MTTPPYQDTHSTVGHAEAHSSGVSWSAVAAGAFTTAALSLILLSLGAGLGLSAVSPWAKSGASASGLGASAIIWLIVMEVISSAMGGYLAGRLRTKWATVHSDEVYFRDTAHGFIAWSTALVVTAAFLASAATTMAGGAVAAKDGQTGTGESGDKYYVDSLFRDAGAKPDAVSEDRRMEAASIFTRALSKGALPMGDQAYLGQVVATATGATPQDSQQRVSTAFADAQQDAETVRKAAAHSLLWTFTALLIGAFCASLAATLGGRQRDNVVTIQQHHKV